MEKKIMITVDPADVAKHQSCHWIPCKVNISGDCYVSKYFIPSIREENNNLTCSLRGRPLDGHKILVPNGYTGIVCTENKKLNVAANQREFKATGSFSEFTYWNWDKIPSSEDKLVKSLDWIEVAPALHKPVSEQECASTPTGQVKRKLSETD